MLERDNRQAAAKDLQKFVRPQQVVRVGRTAEALVAAHEGFVDEHAARRQRRGEQWQAGPEKVVRHDDAVEGLPGKRPGAGLQVARQEADGGMAGQPGKHLRIPIRRHHAAPAGFKKKRMAAVTAGKIEYRAAAGDQRREAADPGGWRRDRQRGGQRRIMLQAHEADYKLGP